MKKALLIALSAMLLLTACGGSGTQSSSSQAISASEPMRTSSSESVGSSSNIPSSSSKVSTVSIAPVANSSISSNANSSVEGSSSTATAKENPNADDLTPAEKFKDSKYHLTTPAKQSWKKAYDTFYQSYIQDIFHAPDPYGFSDTYEVRDNLYYRQFVLDDGNPSVSYEYILKLSRLVENAAKNPEEIMQKYVSKGDFFAIIQDKKTKVYAGEAELYRSKNDVFLGSILHHEEGKYDYRTSMTITEGVENQLLAAGFKPETTEAYALDIPLNSYGVFFIDGKNAAFMPKSDPQGSIFVMDVLYNLEETGCAMANTVVEKPIAPEDRPNPVTGKPVIYLYPERETKVNVKIDYPQDFSYTYPQYNKKYGWQVTAYPDGRLVDSGSNEYYYLFWEGNAKLDWDMSEGFVVEANDTETFLEEKLTYLGLNARERNDFITYWAPEMRENSYNLIHFSTTQYKELAKLAVTPAPSTTIRVHMVYEPCQKNTTVKPQVLAKAPKRTGFTVVEWGGTRGHY